MQSAPLLTLSNVSVNFPSVLPDFWHFWLDRDLIFLILQDQHQNPMEVEKPPAASEVVGVNTSQDSIEDVAAVAPFEDKKGKGNKIPFQ